MIAWWPLIKKFGPWVLLLVVLASVYLVGRSRGGAAWQAKYHSLSLECQVVVAAREQAVNEAYKLGDALERQQLAVRQLEAEQAKQLRTVSEVHRRELERQATSFQRALEEARANTAALELRIKDMSAAEACHEAWLEVLR